MFWDHGYSYRKGKYFPFSNISDLIDQFNYVGYHDVCNYLGYDQLSRIRKPEQPNTKGVRYAMGGYIQQNQTGTE